MQYHLVFPVKAHGIDTKYRRNIECSHTIVVGQYLQGIIYGCNDRLKVVSIDIHMNSDTAVVLLQAQWIDSFVNAQDAKDYFLDGFRDWRADDLHGV